LEIFKLLSPAENIYNVIRGVENRLTNPNPVSCQRCDEIRYVLIGLKKSKPSSAWAIIFLGPNQIDVKRNGININSINFLSIEIMMRQAEP